MALIAKTHALSELQHAASSVVSETNAHMAPMVGNVLPAVGPESKPD